MLLQSLSDPLHTHLFRMAEQVYPDAVVNGTIFNRLPTKKADIKKPTRIATVVFGLLFFLNNFFIHIFPLSIKYMGFANKLQYSNILISLGAKHEAFKWL